MVPEWLPSRYLVENLNYINDRLLEPQGMHISGRLLEPMVNLKSCLLESHGVSCWNTTLYLRGCLLESHDVPEWLSAGIPWCS